MDLLTHTYQTSLHYQDKAHLAIMVHILMYAFDLKVSCLKIMNILQLFYIQTTVSLPSSPLVASPNCPLYPHSFLFSFSSESFPLVSISFSRWIYFSNVIITVVPHLSADSCIWVCQEFIHGCMRATFDIKIHCASDLWCSATGVAWWR